MPRGRLLDAPGAPRYLPPEATGIAVSPERQAEEAVRAGFQQGLARGRAEAAAALETERARLRQQQAEVLATLADLHRALLEEYRDALLALAVEIASRVVRERVAEGDPIVARVAAELLDGGLRTTRRTVRVHPEDHETLLAAVAAISETGPLEIVPDPSVGQGGLIVESAQEITDARLETALAGVREALEDAQ